MSRTTVNSGLIGLVLAASLGACQTPAETTPGAVAAAWPSGISNPTNGGPAFIPMTR